MIGNFHKKKKIFIFVIIISFLYALFLLSPVLLTPFATPKNHINMMVGHYFEDYYEYLSFVKQGQQGHIFIANLFTNDDSSRYLVPWWPYSLIGFIFYLLKINISTQILYWSSAVFFVFCFFVLMYKVIASISKDKFLMQISSFLIIISSSGFFAIAKKRGWEIVVYNFWYSIGSPFSRFNVGTPHHQVTHIVFLSGILSVVCQIGKRWTRSVYISFFLVSLLLLSLSPPQLILFWLSLISSSMVLKVFVGKKKISYKKILSLFLTIGILLLPIVYLMSNISQIAPVNVVGRKWDIKNMYYPPIRLFVMNTGPILVLAIFGIYWYFRKITFERLFLFFVAFFSFLTILVPLKISHTNLLAVLGFHNLRFNTPASYIFLGIATVELLSRIVKRKTYFIAVFVFLVFLSVPPLFRYWQANIKGPQSLGFLQNMPEELYFGLRLLEDQDDQSVVLSSTNSYLGLVIPAIAGRKVYLGRTIFTLKPEEKRANVDKFYTLDMTEDEAKRFLQKEMIGYILLSSRDINPGKMQERYRFLREFYKNSRLVIFSMK